MLIKWIYHSWRWIQWEKSSNSDLKSTSLQQLPNKQRSISQSPVRRSSFKGIIWHSTHIATYILKWFCEYAAESSFVHNLLSTTVMASSHVCVSRTSWEIRFQLCCVSSDERHEDKKKGRILNYSNNTYVLKETMSIILFGASCWFPKTKAIINYWIECVEMCHTNSIIITTQMMMMIIIIMVMILTVFYAWMLRVNGIGSWFCHYWMKMLSSWWFLKWENCYKYQFKFHFVNGKDLGWILGN